MRIRESAIVMLFLMGLIGQVQARGHADTVTYEKEGADQVKATAVVSHINSKTMVQLREDRALLVTRKSESVTNYDAAIAEIDRAIAFGEANGVAE